jgi:glycosyltransferase involved in cell wall biosynthesis
MTAQINEPSTWQRSRPNSASTAPVSVIIPTFNRAHMVTEAIESVFQQTVAPSDIIVVDDGSTDGTRERLAAYIDRINYVYQDNQGVSAARNAGVRAARSPWIAFLDSDDEWHPRKLELQLRYIAEHPETSLLGTMTFVDPSKSWPPLPKTGQVPSQRIVFEDVVIRSPFATSSVIVRKDCFEAIGCFDRMLQGPEDRDMYIRVASRFPVAKLKAVLVWGDIRGAHLSARLATTERASRAMIVRAFKREGVLRGRFLLKRQALSNIAFEASYIYLANGRHWRALKSLVESFLLWPLPDFAGNAVSLRRAKRLVRIITALVSRARYVRSRYRYVHATDGAIGASGVHDAGS